MNNSANDILREQIIQEIERKSKLCSNATYTCTLPRIDGHEYCLRHILRDPRGAYRQCTFAYPNGRKCGNAVLKHDIKKDPALTTFCFEHSRYMQLQKTHASVGRLKRVDTNEALMNKLAHHLNVDAEEEDAAVYPSIYEPEEEIDVVSPYVNPFVNHEQLFDPRGVVIKARRRRRILDYASDSSDEGEPPSISNTAPDYGCNESDNESVDSQDEDVLKHSGIFTRQEAVRISEAKLTKLQGLYIGQINRLHHLLKDRRRRYLFDIRQEREALCSIHDQMKDSPSERTLYGQLKALNTYHRRHGIEAVLHKKFKEKRARVGDPYTKGPSFTKCIYTEGGVKCGDRAMPCAKHCGKHILEDKKQILFRACEREKSGVVCQQPVPCICDETTCVLHLAIPNKRQYIQKKCDSETEDEDMDIEIVRTYSATQEDKKLTKEDTEDASELACQTSTHSMNVTIAHDQNETMAEAVAAAISANTVTAPIVTTTDATA